MKKDGGKLRLLRIADVIISRFAKKKVQPNRGGGRGGRAGMRGRKSNKAAMKEGGRRIVVLHMLKL